jgi:hypothetical protein
LFSSPLLASFGVSLFGLSKTFSGYGVSRVSWFWKKPFCTLFSAFENHCQNMNKSLLFSQSWVKE